MFASSVGAAPAPRRRLFLSSTFRERFVHTSSTGVSRLLRFYERYEHLSEQVLLKNSYHDTFKLKMSG